MVTRDVDRAAAQLSRQINAGTVWTNTWMVIGNNGFEEGGYKQSGLGRLRGARGLADWEIKTCVHFVPPRG